MLAAASWLPLAGQLSASCVSGQERQAASHCKCLLEMEQPGLVAAAAVLTARAARRLRVSGFVGGMGTAAWEMASQGEPGSASRARNVWAPDLGNRTWRSKGRRNQSHSRYSLLGFTKPASIPGIKYLLVF